ncbi:DUF1835 domain-containing protein [Metabacillus sp. SLBN-84]
MIHIVFGTSVSGSLKFVLKEMGIEKEDKVISFGEMFSIGPVWKLHENNGLQSRFEWMKRCVSEEYGEWYKQDVEKAFNQIEAIPKGTHITIWTSNNAHEQTGLRFISYLLKDKSMDIDLINTADEYKEILEVKKGKYVPLHTGEIPPEKLQVLYEQGHAKFVKDHDRVDLEKEWLALSDGQETLRIWRNGGLQSVPEDYYDDFMIITAKKLQSKTKTKDFMKSARLIGEVLGHLQQYVGDSFLEYRLKKLIEAGIFESEGSLLAMRFYSVRLKS